MGQVRVSIRLANPLQPEQTVSVADALVDTGTTYTVVPRSLAQQLNLPLRKQRRIPTAAGLQTLDESYAILEFGDDSTVAPVLISETLDIVLVGVIRLEAPALALAVDPKSGQLRPAEIVLL